VTQDDWLSQHFVHRFQPNIQAELCAVYQARAVALLSPKGNPEFHGFFRVTGDVGRVLGLATYKLKKSGSYGVSIGSENLWGRAHQGTSIPSTRQEKKETPPSQDFVIMVSTSETVPGVIFFKVLVMTCVAAC